ncbi:MAG TPA: alpha amylase C-terminal domain-containing protein, partial [Nitrospira sp.]|nr:alpha amylase C-terminal domain-containing protein [Nitrospira sp.]
AFFQYNPIYRRFHQNQITFGLLYAFSENFILALSHDEVVYGKRALLDKMPGDVWQRFANLRLLYGFMYSHPGKKMLFMGSEFGQWQEWNHDTSLDWHLCESEPHQGLQRLTRDLNQLYGQEPALYEIDFDWDGFQWIDFSDSNNSVIAYLRKARKTGEAIVCVCNFTPMPRYSYRIGVPEGGWYRELVNTDGIAYGGSNIGNGGGLQADETRSHGFPYSLTMTLPPLSALLLKREG